MFKRPIPRPRIAKTACGPPRCIPTGTPGRVGEIATAMHRGSDSVRSPAPSKWRPSYDYEFLARHQADPEAYLARCEAWFAENKPLVPATPNLARAVDFTPVADLFAKYEGHLPPIDERVEAMRKAGYSENVITKAVARDAFMKATVDERQKALDLIFARWPSINKPTPKSRAAKPIKAVKKKMN
jgi:hypothetical protein